MKYYIADQHFFHRRINEAMDRRGFQSVEEMNDYMIKQWNSKVLRNDDVVILGDLSLARGRQTNELLQQLNGNKYLITGNHDKYLADKSFDQNLFKWIKPYAELNDGNRKVILCHYPIFCYNGQFRRNKDGDPKTWMLHGHTHLTPDQQLVEQFKDITRKTTRPSRGTDSPEPAPIQMINCFCMLSDYVPLTLDEWIELENSGKIRRSLQNDWRYDDSEETCQKK